jgi:hypothetical protein
MTALNNNVEGEISKTWLAESGRIFLVTLKDKISKIWLAESGKIIFGWGIWLYWMCLSPIAEMFSLLTVKKNLIDSTVQHFSGTNHWKWVFEYEIEKKTTRGEGVQFDPYYEINF